MPRFRKKLWGVEQERCPTPTGARSEPTITKLPMQMEVPMTNSNDLSRSLVPFEQNASPSNARHPAALATALVAHCRGGRGTGGRTRVPAARLGARKTEHGRSL